MTSNLQRLGKTLDDRMKKTSGAAAKITLEFGVISDNLYLTTDSIKTPIPQADYMIDLRLTHPDYRGSNESDGDPQHKHRSPGVFRRLQPGDRVLVAWIGFEPVVICIVVSGETINES